MPDSTPAATAPGPETAEDVQVDPGLASLLRPEALKARQELLKDWTQFVAADDIMHGGVLAYAKGSPVPASNVKRWQYDKAKLVVKRDSAEGKRLLEEAVPRTPATAVAPGD